MRIAPALGNEPIGNPLLYRALRSDEVEAGCVLIPRAQGPFAARSRSGAAVRAETPEARAVRQRQWRQRGCPVRGVSTTPHLERARRYAAPGGIVVELDRRLFERNWIHEYPVNEVLARFPAEIVAPEDEEVILVCELEGALPKEIVRRVLRVDAFRRTAPALSPREAEPWNTYAFRERELLHGERKA